jgi:hypothetical protein
VTTGDDSHWGTYADWVVAGATLLLAFVAALQDRIRAWFDSPKFEITTDTAPPCCVMVPAYSVPDGLFIANYVFLRIRVNNVGSAAARNVEVYAHSLHRICDDANESVKSFPPMNLKWADTNGAIYIPSISPYMGRYCDICHVADPARRTEAEKPRYAVPTTQTTMAFDLQAAPNHKGHIVGPGQYLLEVRVAAENCPPIGCSIQITLQGSWNSDETTMLRDFVNIKVLKTYEMRREPWRVFFFGQWPK